MLRRNARISIVRCLLLSSPATNLEPPKAETRLQCLAGCKPLSSAEPALRRIVRMLLDSSAVDKARIFIKPSDLVHSTPRFPIGDWHQKATEKDVISKGLFLRHGPRRTCLRCGGESESGGDPERLNSRWAAWDKRWIRRCLCGGNWIGRSL